MTAEARTDVTHPSPRVTHEVVNQAPPRVDLDEYALNPVLVEAVGRHGAGWAQAELTEIGALVGSASFQRDAAIANTLTPTLQTHDRWGHRIDEVEYHPSYHRIMGAAVAHGAHTAAWAEPRPGAHVARAAAFMLFAQVEPGHACPISMTYAVVPALRSSPSSPRSGSRASCLARLRPAAARPPARRRARLFGMAMTEKQGGSDVRANTTVGRPHGGGPGAEYELTGHKWFCSAPMCDAFLVARPQAPRAGSPASWCRASCPTAPATASASSG